MIAAEGFFQGKNDTIKAHKHTTLQDRGKQDCRFFKNITTMEVKHYTLKGLMVLLITYSDSVESVG